MALVSIPVEIFPATKAGKSIAFHQIHEPSGQRVKYEKVVPGIGPVDRDEILKGFEVENDPAKADAKMKTMVLRRRIFSPDPREYRPEKARAPGGPAGKALVTCFR